MALACNRRSLIIGGPAAILAFHAVRASADTSTRTTAQEVEKVMDAFLAAYGARDIERMVSLMSPDIYFEDPTFHLIARNRDEMKPIYEPLRDMFQSVKITPFNRIVAPPWGISQQRIGGTLVRNGQAQNVDVQGLSMFEIEGGMIKRWYDYYDVLTFREQARGNPAS